MARTSAKLRWHAWLAAACALWLCVISLAAPAGAPARGAGFTGNERPALSAMPELLADAGEAHRRRRDHDAAVAIVHPCAPTPPVACRAATGLADIRILFRSAVASAPRARRRDRTPGCLRTRICVPAAAARRPHAELPSLPFFRPLATERLAQRLRPSDLLLESCP